MPCRNIIVSPVQPGNERTSHGHNQLICGIVHLANKLDADCDQERALVVEPMRDALGMLESRRCV